MHIPGVDSELLASRGEMGGVVVSASLGNGRVPKSLNPGLFVLLLMLLGAFRGGGEPTTLAVGRAGRSGFSLIAICKQGKINAPHIIPWAHRTERARRGLRVKCMGGCAKCSTWLSA